jgi:hypothetical protein
VLALLAAAVLAQPPVALVQSSNFGVPARRAADLTHTLAEMLRKQGLNPVEVTGTCEDHPCLLAKAAEVKAVAVISIAFAVVGKETLIDLEALRTRDEAALAQATFKLPANSGLRPGETGAFIEKIEMAVQPSVVAEPVKEPTPPKEEPHVTPPARPEPVQPLVEAPVESEPSHLPVYVVGAATLLSAAVSGTFLGLALAQGAQVNGSITTDASGAQVSMLMRTVAQQKIALENRYLTYAAVVGGIAAALLVTTLVMWLVGS